MTAVCEHEAARRARSLETHGFRRAAIDVLEAALMQEPDAGPLWRLRAVLLAREGRHDEAFHDVQRALALVPLGQIGLLILADGYARTGLVDSAADVYQTLACDEDRPHELWPAIFAGLFRLRRWTACLELCRRAAHERPDDDRAYLAMAQSLARLGRPAETIIAVLGKALDLNPADVRARVLMAMQQLRCGLQSAAYACVAELSPESYAEIDCGCCAWKLLRLCVTAGDSQRAALLGARLAQLSAVRRGQAAEEER
jgi:tetratricopeptide (TPR) repeat protein